MKEIHIRFKTNKIHQTVEILAMVCSGCRTELQCLSIRSPQTPTNRQSLQHMLNTSRRHQVKSLSCRPLDIGITSVTVRSKTFSWVSNIVICQSRILGQIIVHSHSKYLCIYGKTSMDFAERYLKLFFCFKKYC